jgi:hypothetical protein
MKLALKKINELIAGANPDAYKSISYNKYYRDLTDISNNIMQDDETQNKKNAELMKAINSLKDDKEKEILLDILFK